MQRWGLQCYYLPGSPKPLRDILIGCSWEEPTVIEGVINKFPIWSSPNSTDGQQVPQQSPPTVEVTPPDSHSEGNGVMEEQTEGDGLGQVFLHSLLDF